MNGSCTRCGRDLFVDFRAKLRRCSGCERGPAFCSCAPVAAPARWVGLARQRERGLARDLTVAA